jgi:DNA primase
VISNQFFYGEDSVRGAETVYVAEGVTDCLAMLQAGYPTISPVTTRFRHEDVARLLQLTRNAESINLVPDAEENQAGIKGAINTAAVLEDAAKAAFIVSLPRPEGIDKVDVTDFLRDYGKEAFDSLVAQAKTPLQIEIDEIAKENLDPIRLSDQLNSVKEKLSTMPRDKAEGYFVYVKSVLGLKGDYVNGLRKETRVLSEASAERDEEESSTIVLSALFPVLVIWLSKTIRLPT